MILIDISQIMIANLMKHIAMKGKDVVIDEALVRHMILNGIRSYRKKFHQEYGEIVICCDARENWRRECFQYYKAHRKDDREESSFDWSAIFDAMSKISEEIRVNLPYKNLLIDKAEADDIIAALCSEYGSYYPSQDKILIVSSDKDFLQLQKYMNVAQYSPRDKEFMRINNPARFLREHIILGDRGDGIPNIMTQDDAIYTKTKQKSVPRKMFDVWTTNDPTSWCKGEMLRNYKRNEQLIDFECIPGTLKSVILEQFQTQVTPERKNIINYFMNHRLSNLIESLGDF